MILVTGGAGFIGSVLARKLNLLGHQNLIIVDRLADSKKWLNLRKIEFDTYIQADEFLEHELEEIAPQLTHIFHIGACSSTTEMDMDYLMTNNVDYSKVLFSVAQAHNIPFIYASSAATYGSGESGYVDDHSTIPSLRPLNPYGYSKQLFDCWALKQSNAPKVWRGFKFFNVFGPNEYHKEEMRSLVHKAFGQINDCGEVKLFKSHRDDFKDGEQMRDFIYVDDIVSALVYSFEHPEALVENGIYNLGTGVERSFKDLVSNTFKAMDVPEKIKFVDMPLSIRNQYQYFTQADMTKFKRNFKGFSFRTLEDSVTEYVQKYLMREDRFY